MFFHELPWPRGHGHWTPFSILLWSSKVILVLLDWTLNPLPPPIFNVLWPLFTLTYYRNCKNVTSAVCSLEHSMVWQSDGPWSRRLIERLSLHVRVLINRGLTLLCGSVDVGNPCCVALTLLACLLRPVTDVSWPCTMYTWPWTLKKKRKSQELFAFVLNKHRDVTIWHCML